MNLACEKKSNQYKNERCVCNLLCVHVLCIHLLFAGHTNTRELLKLNERTNECVEKKKEDLNPSFSK